MAKNKESETTDTEIDGSLLPPNLFGLEVNRPFRPEIDRTTYHATDSGEFSIFIDNQWIVVENRKAVPK
jgi:hypothetical protein